MDVARPFDPLFRTAALALGRRVIGIVLSGALDDGAAGMLDIKNAGGATIVQAPEDALYSGMPRSVLERMKVDRVLPAAAIAGAVVELVGRAVPGQPAPSAPEEDACRAVLERGRLDTDADEEEIEHEQDENAPNATAEAEAETRHDPEGSEGA